MYGLTYLVGSYVWVNLLGRVVHMNWLTWWVDLLGGVVRMNWLTWWVDVFCGVVGASWLTWWGRLRVDLLGGVVCKGWLTWWGRMRVDLLGGVVCKGWLTWWGRMRVDLLGGVICAGWPVGGVGPEEATPHAHIRPFDIVDSFKCATAPQLLHSLGNQGIGPVTKPSNQLIPTQLNRSWHGSTRYPETWQDMNIYCPVQILLTECSLLLLHQYVETNTYSENYLYGVTA